jgi:hypothetical protein
LAVLTDSTFFQKKMSSPPGTCELVIEYIDEHQHPFPRVTTGTLVAWLFFNISASQFFLPVFVAALFYTKPKSPRTLISVVFAWILYGLVSSILLYSGNADGCEPPPLLCLAQAALYIALPPMTTTALFCAILQIWFDIRQKLYHALEEKDHTIRRVCLLTAPYIIYAIFATVTAATGAASAFFNAVSRRRRTFYCSIREPLLTNIVVGYCTIILLAGLVFVVWIVMMLRQNWPKLHRSVTNTLDFGYIFRMLGFFFYNVLALSMALLPENALVVSDMFMSLSGYVVLFFFATRRTVLEVFLTRFNFMYRRNTARESKAAEQMRIVSV